MDAAFTAHNSYYSRKKFLKILGGEIRIYDEGRNNLLFFVKQKALKLKEDITIFADEGQSRPLLKIQARSIIDLGATYDVSDANTGEKIGAVRRKAMASLMRDTWVLLGPQDNEIGTVMEDSMGMALLRRFLTNLVPQNFTVRIGEQEAGEFRQTFNPFIAQFQVSFKAESSLDRRLGIAALVLVQIIEGRQG